MCSIRLLEGMASGWRGYLEEESEYQWIAMTGFLIFILLGAVAIQGTSNLPGVKFGSNDASHADTRVLDIEYSSDTAFTAKVVTATGIDLYMQTGSGSVTRIIDSSSSTDASEMQFMTKLENHNVVVASDENTLMVIHDPKNVATGEVLISTIQLDNSTGDFEIADLAEQTSGGSTSRSEIKCCNPKNQIRDHPEKSGIYPNPAAESNLG